ncbi:hypothetical protein BTA51_14405 [Hahella sp. CCB-MM4]|uniref:HpcH/HpaI aldolase/citrate lyase family protein n=1 Tax=Hahella sp. (strain CCB-MM4) TaxID=1926491 RepID=UPI000B9B0FA6|nr:CoA ester lyase [Hahella sp. CCB-MM4]OZG72714.1 hypothetical protein BTA51_14405 [Hahella sp. CCB-MM4]
MESQYISAKSYLFVPANRQDFIRKAVNVAADVIIIDLEDSVPMAAKAEARGGILETAQRLFSEGKRVAVRVNNDLGNLAADLQSLPLSILHSILLPKAQNAGIIQMIDQYLVDLELQQSWGIGSTSLIPMIESCTGVLNLRSIAKSSPRVRALALGSEDLAADLGVPAVPESLLATCQHMALVAGEARLDALGFPGSIGEFNDLDQLGRNLMQAKSLGFGGALCIHPTQVPIVNQAFAYPLEQQVWARRVIDAMAVAQSHGQGTAKLDGRMLDAPVVALANRILGQ